MVEPLVVELFQKISQQSHAHNNSHIHRNAMTLTASQAHTHAITLTAAKIAALTQTQLHTASSIGANDKNWWVWNKVVKCKKSAAWSFCTTDPILYAAPRQISPTLRFLTPFAMQLLASALRCV